MGFAFDWHRISHNACQVAFQILSPVCVEVLVGEAFCQTRKPSISRVTEPDEKKREDEQCRHGPQLEECKWIHGSGSRIMSLQSHSPSRILRTDQDAGLQLQIILHACSPDVFYLASLGANVAWPARERDPNQVPGHGIQHFR
ncbi:predicted protein [Verticillium alfalfae VaMs.102]|uniref:Predicted protein n=1 Tax=Verticillium alfalfae (strain VaMs.102 / ATCC MYA-4576 / FGSC 10136) TaxID=526221 RepID=C9S5I1_VERA1|nr:predicted protein [Verticillium alfalfae VaMs.102]EEY15058.1 predicted protein [Verticillium alfalfae VaMs.102]